MSPLSALASAAPVSSGPLHVPLLSLDFTGPAARPDEDELQARNVGWAQARGLIGPRGGTRITESSLLGPALAGGPADAFPDLYWTPGFTPAPEGFIKRCSPRLDVPL